MEDGCLPSVPIHDDVCTFEPKGAALKAEALLAGWPCQARTSNQLTVISNFQFSYSASRG